MLWLLLAACANAQAFYYNNSQEYASGAMGGFVGQSYVTTDFENPILNFEVPIPSTPNPGYLFWAPRGGSVPMDGPVITDMYGGLIWYGANLIGQTLPFQAFTYNGQEVLATWMGSFNANGWGDGVSVLVDNSYNIINNISNTIQPGQNDFHEFFITQQGTAIVTVYVLAEADLSSYNVQTTDGSQGWVITGHFQEINIATGEAVFSWNSSDHIPFSASYTTPGTSGTSNSDPWDWIHMNSVEKDSSGNYLVSARHTHALYYVSGQNGTILWTINGMNSSFAMGQGSTFEWQHMARWVTEGQSLTVFDNAGDGFVNSEATARGLQLNIDMSSMSVTLAEQMIPWQNETSPSQGSVQPQPDGNFLVGWGAQPYFSEYSPSGQLLWSAQFGVSTNDSQTYRVVKSNWTGAPQYPPAYNVTTNSTGSFLYVSWNGATEVAQWQVIGGTSNSNATPVMNVTKNGFETSMQITPMSYLAVQGLDSTGKPLLPAAVINGTGNPPEPTATTSSVTPSGTASAAAIGTTSAKSGAGRRMRLMGMEL